MASRSWLEDIDDSFCKCPICRQLFDKPKYLPCLHRYCSLCLKLLIEGHSGSLQCPECDEEFTVPVDGVDGLQNDVFMEEIIRYIQLLQLLKNDQTIVCCSCSKSLKVTAYCFKCDGFLCKVCEQSHLTNKSLREHQSYSLPMGCNDSKKVNVEKLFAAMGPLHCSSHSQEPFSMCCETCNNILTCMTCAFGKHNGHTICEVKYVAEIKRKELSEELNSLIQNKDYIYKIPERLDITKKWIKANVNKLSEKLQSNYEKEVTKRKERIEEIDAQGQLAIAEAGDIDNVDLPELTKQMEDEIQRIREKYDKLRDEKRKEMKNRILNEFNQKYSSELTKINQELEIIDSEYKSLSMYLETQESKNYETILEISQYAENSKKKLQNLEVIITSVLSSSSKWAVVHLAFDLLKAVKALVAKTKKQFPRLETLSHITHSNRCTQFVHFYHETKAPSISSRGNRITNFTQSSLSEDWEIFSFDVSNKGNITVLGNRPVYENGGCRNKGFIAGYFGNLNASNCQMIVPLTEKISFPVYEDGYYHGQYGCIVSSDDIVTLHQQHQKAVYDIRDASKITETQLKWGECKGSITGLVATDHEKKQFYFLAETGKHVFVFDETLSYLYTLTLPVTLSAPSDMILRGNNLIICGYIGRSRRTYSFSFHGSGVRLMFEFVMPANVNVNSAYSVSTDERGFFYILWEGYVNYGSYGNRKKSACIARYSRCGHHLLNTTVIDQVGSRLRINKSSILILSLYKKIYSYSLVSFSVKMLKSNFAIMK